MLSISREEILAKMRLANPWWAKPEKSSVPFNQLRPRAYFHQFRPLAAALRPVRAALLMGPRRVGKTVLVFHFIRSMIAKGYPAKSLIYLDLQQPLYNGLGLEQMLVAAMEASDATPEDGLYVCFDEIQYLRSWEVHLKALVDSYPSIKFIATGSAAAALRLKSNESGAGRFTDFVLPPLTFYEYLDLIGEPSLVGIVKKRNGRNRATSTDKPKVNELFLAYLNSGGYPEAALSEEVQSDLGRYIRSDVIDKVLLKDLPSLYGIQDIQELNSLFATLAYNTANEVSLSELAQNSGVAKNTLKKYIEYLESAFLLRVVHRVDRNAKRFQRANYFKVYLTNPSIRSALFSPVGPDDEAMGNLVETAVFSQWFHSLYTELHYARWDRGEVDIVHLDPKQRPLWGIEVKWSDRFVEKPHDLKSLKSFGKKHPECQFMVTTRTKQASRNIDGRDINFVPASLYCYLLGYNIINNRAEAFDIAATDDEGE